MPHPATGRSAGHRPWLDGVRGVAVLLVVCSHLGRPSLTGLGALGVAVFFALSGYLITGLLLDEHAREGRIRLTDFVVRRAARLLPALLLMVVVCDALYVAAGRPEVVPGSVLALLYVANYATIVAGDYLPGFEHTWSLAIEEQFYLLWPLALLVLLPRRPLASLLRVTLLLCAASLAWRCVLVLGLGVGRDGAFAAPELLLYHGTLERADALLYGCAAALAVRTGWRPRAWLGWCGAGVLVLTPFVPGPRFAMTVLPALVAVAASALVVALDHVPGLLRRVLSLAVLARVGVLSYGVYLWHLPLLLLAYGSGTVGPTGGLVVAFVLTPAVAAASYHGLERPVRAHIMRRCGRASLAGPQTGTPGAGTLTAGHGTG